MKSAENDLSFLDEVSNIILRDFPNDRVCVFLPNRRGCRELKKTLRSHVACVRENSLEKHQSQNCVLLPEIRSIQDVFVIDRFKLSMIILRILSDHLKFSKISINTVIDLSNSLCDFLEQLILFNVNIDTIRDFVPDELMEYWQHTISMIDLCMANSEICNFIRDVKIQFEAFIDATSYCGDNIVVAGIFNANYYTDKFLAIVRSINGLILSPEDFNNSEHKRNLELAEFNNLSSEAFAISIAVRRAIFENKSVLIVSPNADLSRQIQSHLRKWNVEIDTSFGDVFSKTFNGICASIALDILSNNFNICDVINFLKVIPNLESAVLKLELFLRKKMCYPRSTISIIRIIYDFCDENKLHELKSMIEKIHDVYKILLESNDCKYHFCDLFDLHSKLILLVSGDSNDAFNKLAFKYLEYADTFGDMCIDEYAVFVKNKIFSNSIRTPVGYSDNVIMLGAMEAQLSSADYVIIASANETSWLVTDKNDFWLSKSMLKYMKIDFHEKKNCYMELIFHRLLKNKNVLITRSKVVSGSSQLICKYLEPVGLNQADWLYDLLNVYYAIERERIMFRAPNPPIDLRPTKYSVTDISDLIKNPYEFYAKKILCLKEIDKLYDKRNFKGNYIHSVLEKFFKSNYHTYDEILKIADSVMSEIYICPEDFGLSFFRHQSIWKFILGSINTSTKYLCEISGNISIQLNDEKSVIVFCRADRIDVFTNGDIEIIDYKTGIIPSQIKVKNGFAPQLAIEGLIASKDGFGINYNNVVSINFVELKPAECKKISIDAICDDLFDSTHNGIIKLLTRYLLDGDSFSLQKTNYSSPYLHLARLKEVYND